MSCCGGKHINIIPVLQMEDSLENKMLLSNPENKETIWLEHLVGGAPKVYTVGKQNYMAGGKFRFIEVFAEHKDQLLKMSKVNRPIFRVAVFENPVIELVTNNDEQTEIVVDLEKLEEEKVLIVEDTVLEVTDEGNSELTEEKPKASRKKKNEASEE